jgi:hypothetical protein
VPGGFVAVGDRHEKGNPNRFGVIVACRYGAGVRPIHPYAGSRLLFSLCELNPLPYPQHNADLLRREIMLLRLGAIGPDIVPASWLRPGGRVG